MSEHANNDNITILGRPAAESKGFDDIRITKAVSSGVLQANLKKFAATINDIVDPLFQSVQSYELDEVEINVEVSASGNIWLVGSVEAGSTGGVLLRFKRKKEASNE